MEPQAIQETFEQAINRLRDEIAPIKTDWKVEEDLNPKINFIIAKALELNQLLQANMKSIRLEYGYSIISHVPCFLKDIQSLNADYIFTERSLSSQIEHLNRFLSDPYSRRTYLRIIQKGFKYGIFNNG